MMFSSMDEVRDWPTPPGKVEHARPHQGPAAQGPLPEARRRSSKQEAYGKRIDTTVGRVMFNDILPTGMAFYNLAAAVKRPGPHHRRLLPDARPPRRRSSCSTT